MIGNTVLTPDELRAKASQPNLLDWQRRCYLAGGQPTRDPITGAPACRIMDANNRPVYHDAALTMSDRWFYATTQTKEAVDRAAGQAVAIRDTALDATGLNKGAIGVLSKATGIPAWLLVGVGLAWAYSVFANAGLLPKIRD